MNGHRGGGGGRVGRFSHDSPRSAASSTASGPHGLASSTTCVRWRMHGSIARTLYDIHQNFLHAVPDTNGALGFGISEIPSGPGQSGSIPRETSERRHWVPVRVLGVRGLHRVDLPSTTGTLREVGPGPIGPGSTSLARPGPPAAGTAVACDMTSDAEDPRLGTQSELVTSLQPAGQRAPAPVRWVCGRRRGLTRR